MIIKTKLPQDSGSHPFHCSNDNVWYKCHENVFCLNNLRNKTYFKNSLESKPCDHTCFADWTVLHFLIQLKISM